MDILRGLYVAVLATLVLLSGCFGSGVFDTSEGQDGEDDDGTGTNGGGGQGEGDNMAPLIEILSIDEVEPVDIYSSGTGELLEPTHYNLTVYRAMADLDGNITSAGWDFNLDGTIDQASTGMRALEYVLIPASEFVNASPIFHEEEFGGINLISTIAFIAIDDDGAMSAELVSAFYHDYYGGGTGSSGTLNTYDADDTATDASSGTSDTLIRLQMTGQDTLAWAFTIIQLSVGDNVHMCSVGGGDACTISQQGGDNANSWEPGEFIFLAESGTDICSDVGCSVEISVTYNGNIVVGDGSVVVN